MVLVLALVLVPAVPPLGVWSRGGDRWGGTVLAVLVGVGGAMST